MEQLSNHEIPEYNLSPQETDEIILDTFFVDRRIAEPRINNSKHPCSRTNCNCSGQNCSRKHTPETAVHEPGSDISMNGDTGQSVSIETDIPPQDQPPALAA